jgi:hypothetical protein
MRSGRKENPSSRARRRNAPRWGAGGSRASEVQATARIPIIDDLPAPIDPDSAGRVSATVLRRQVAPPRVGIRSDSRLLRVGFAAGRRAPGAPCGSQKSSRLGDGLGEPDAVDRHALGKGAEETRGHRRVEQHEDAPVVGAPDEASEGLLQPEPRQPVVVEPPA